MHLLKTQLVFCFLLCSFSLFAQQKVDQLIPNAEKKKVELAQRYFNQFKIYDGEKILKDLIRAHPNEAYYYEALVGLQRQVLRKLTYARQELNELEPTITDSAINTNEFIKDDVKELSSRKKLLESTGLDRVINSDQEDKFKKRKKKEVEVENEIEMQASVTIDSTILNQDNENNDDETIDQLGNSSISTEEKLLKKKLKVLSELSSIPYESYKNELLRNAREATRLVENADSCSYYLREFLVDTINTSHFETDELKELWENAYISYQEDNYVVAAKLLNTLLETYPDDYAALLKLGDTYYMMGKDTLAIKQYHLAQQAQPKLSLALEKLALASYNRGRFKEAASYIIEAIIIYPQQHYFNLLKRIVAKSGRGFETQWIQRQVFPATTSKNFEEVVVDNKSPWWHYQAAKQEVYSYFDTLGLVRPNEKTRERYLEIYTWKKMLNNSSPKLFSFARAMNQIGYLDCYTLVSLFHQDLYSQFRDFAARNPEKIKEYFYMLINWNDKKFDKLRKLVSPVEKAKTEIKK